ncbi:protoporphyrinogen oxidase [Neobacillus mesonae]|nr:protoporphyrinogen oxidase [Neobacillus mesonae]
MKTVAIVGGGITGLSCAYHLQKEIQTAGLAARIVLLEASTALGGKISTVHDGEYTMETGADSIVTRKKNTFQYIEQLGLTERVVYNETGTSFIHSEGALKQIPDDSMFGIPMSIESLASTTLVSAEGKVEALKDFYTPNEKFTKKDSLGSFLEAFLGKEFVEKQIAPVISGVYSGNLYDLTLASTLPYLLDYKNEYGSLIKGLSEQRSKLKSSGEKKFLSFAGGMSDLIDAFEQELSEVDIRKQTSVNHIESVNSKYILDLSSGDKVEADYVVLSVPHTAAEKMLDKPELSKDFEQLKSSSLISVYLGFDIPDSELPANGTGFITSEASDLKCNACTWASRKWKHTSKHSRLLVRLFYKSTKPVYDSLISLSEEELIHVALSDVREAMGISSEPVTHHVRKWHEEMPNYHMKHHELVESLEQNIEVFFPGIWLAGCSYYGVGIPDCMQNGEKTAAQVMEQLNAQV